MPKAVDDHQPRTTDNQAYLKGGALTTIKSLTRSFGVTFTRKSLEKSMPFGIGAVIGTSLNYGFTLYVGREAVKCFLIEREAA